MRGIYVVLPELRSVIVCEVMRFSLFCWCLNLMSCVSVLGFEVCYLDVLVESICVFCCAIIWLALKVVSLVNA